jgi:Ni,Fe-hydrogenase III small subunit
VTDYRVLVTASRDLADQVLVRWALDEQMAYASSRRYDRLVVVHGACPTGGDKFADVWAVEKGFEGHPVTYERHPAKGHPTMDFGPWPGCGPRRNNYMVGLGADVCLAFIGPCTSPRCRRIDPHGSHGATGCSDRAEQAGIATLRWKLWEGS